MKDEKKSKNALIEELREIRQKVNALETSEIKNKQVEKALPESEVKYRSLFENMLNGFAYLKLYWIEITAL